MLPPIGDLKSDEESSAARSRLTRWMLLTSAVAHQRQLLATWRDIIAVPLGKTRLLLTSAVRLAGMSA
jgi:hypothetical protein